MFSVLVSNLRYTPCLWGRIIEIQITLASVYLHLFIILFCLTKYPTICGFVKQNVHIAIIS